jgi:glycine cleavage system H protein
MDFDDSNALFYKRSLFVTRLPLNRLYSSSHFWLLHHAGIWRIGLTKFATRMLGEIVDYGFDTEPDAVVQTGQILGWIEGFKAISDVASVIRGKFRSSNPGLSANPEFVDRDCYGDGWLYEATGDPDITCLDVHGYKALLDATIDKLSEKRTPSE